MTLTGLLLLTFAACRRELDAPAGWDDLADVGLDNRLDVSPYDVGQSIIFAELIDNSELQSISGGEQWRALRVEQGEVDDKGLNQLDRFPHLEEIVLRHSPISDRGAEEIAKLTELRIVNLPHTEMTDVGVAKLAALPKLELLRLGSRKLTDRALEVLRESSSLRFLHLIDVPISDRGLQSLQGWQQLESLYLDGSQVSDRGVQLLLKTCPALHLHLNQHHHDLDPMKGHD